MAGRSSEAPARLEADSAAMPRIVAGRYEVQALLAQGGMARVYRARDAASGAVVALKWLDLKSSEEQTTRSIELLEREYHTLVQLAHPRVVQAYEYGVDGDNPYYTMELLDGGDLRELAPMPWQEVCRVAYDVCSALSLLHSRRLIHLDLTPRNIRRTSDGTAKLIDFGLLAPMGPRTLMAGTPSYTSPEVMANITLDGRADLFSLGATMYYALSGRAAYPATRLQHLQEVWRTTPHAPSRLVKGLPEALDALVLSMVRLDVGSRPKSAAEVMERLLPLIGGAPSDLLGVTHAYLSTPQLIGRGEIVKLFRKQTVRSLRDRGGGFIVSGPAGIGRSRVLDAFVLEAKLVGARTLRASAADGAAMRFGAAAALARQALVAFPEESLAAAQSDAEIAALFEQAGDRGVSLTDITRSERSRAKLHNALCAWFLLLAQRRPIAIAVDDLHRIDDASAAFVASLASEAAGRRIVYAITLVQDGQEKTSDALTVLREHAQSIVLAPLTPDEIATLLGSVFGDVSNLELLRNRLYPLCGGRPRECLALAKQLVDDGAITYRGGTWSLPESYAQGALPTSIEQALDRQASQLHAPARHVAALLGMGLLGRLSRSQLLLAEAETSASVDQALDELLSAQLVTGDRNGYALCHEGFGRWISSRLEERERQHLHGQLARIYQESKADPVLVAHHLLSGGAPDHGLTLLLSCVAHATTSELAIDRALSQTSVDVVARTLQLALREAERSKRPERELLLLRERLAHMTTLGDDPSYYYDVADACLAQYKRDSGHDIWQNLDAGLSDKARAEQAIVAAFERYNQPPETERVLSPIDAIKGLVRWVAISLPVAARISDLNLLASLPALIEPFACVSPVVDAMVRNARATVWLRCEGRWQEARQLWSEVLRDLESSSDIDTTYLTRVRTAIHFALGATDALLGIPSDWADRLEQGEHDPMQLAQVYYVRKMAALSQGDWEAAERHRRHAETLRLRSKMYQSISTLLMELVVHAAARDLTGLRQVRSGIHATADLYPGWQPIKHFADAHYARLCGDLAEAMCAVDRALEDGATRFPDMEMLSASRVLKIELLVGLEQTEQAIALARPTLARYRASGIHQAAREIERALALAEAKNGNFEAAMTGIERVIDEQLQVGISGTQLGLSYETATRIAIWAHDANAFEKYLALTAQRYRPGFSSVLGALYGRLQDEARSAGLSDATPAPFEYEDAPSTSGDSAWFTHRVVAAMAGRDTWEQRAAAALQLLCDERQLRGGHLFLLTERGLELAASNIEHRDMDEAHRFVQGFLTAEINAARGDDIKTQTLLNVVAADTSGMRTEWTAVDGTAFTAIPVSGVHEGQWWIVGVALFRELTQPSASLAGLVSAITACFVRDGDAKGAVVV